VHFAGSRIDGSTGPISFFVSIIETKPLAGCRASTQCSPITLITRALCSGAVALGEGLRTS
jgi:hypothetical protein